MSAALISALLMLQAATPPSRPPPSNEDLPGWTRTPSAADMAAAYPAEARAANFAGSATIECSVAAGGRLADCVTVGEVGSGFGDAALAVAPKFQMPVKSPSGASMIGRTVRFPVQWVNPAAGRPQAAVMYDDVGRSGSVGFNCRVLEDRSLDNGVVVDAQPRGTTLFAPAGEVVLRTKARASADPGSRLMVVVEIKPRS